MDFPIYISFGLFKLHPHLLFESLAYFIGFRVYLKMRGQSKLTMIQAMWVVFGAIVGASIGSKLLAWLEDPMRTIEQWNHVSYLMQGKTIVGGLLGGLIGVELIKKRVGITRSTGDDMIFALITGMTIGRIGCFLTGLSDQTYGIPTSWITGIDFGDGVMRHPTQLYEIVFLVFLGVLLYFIKKNIPLHDGALFQLFMIGYLSWRLLIDFIKPTPHPYWGLNNIQIACLLGLIYYGWICNKNISGERKRTKNA
ncbi:Prolipoprotein diacylglyceryl transferase [Seinonella peptonophila]|uniref:Prolipoprotein diacylglyceryl transferase n=1 Tax=Seinonella peptonophila TaxID=112248 RepID=A0A1M5BAZ0_9BACL|nr:prolipoprotein diacylglyceryl transferase family protein [Seinonella peptonophila]SHF39674.1 Prolipoprotein diacylglyceryl transferase [Seinonella peptonophila]